MATQFSFGDEIANLMYATHGNPIRDCLQCGTCSGTCPSVEFMDHTPRQIIGLIGADFKDEVLASNTYWSCASCYHCTVRCPAGIDIADMMYALKRYSMWKSAYREGLIGPAFSESFVKMIVDSGRSFEPALAPSYLFKYGPRGLVQEAQTAAGLMLKGRLPLLPKKIKGLKNFQRMVRRIIPIGESS
ncbi:MAG: 4Fe-4S dicluster domain-containing protein [Chloroflexi bacterium]|nr:4Fe-4S dicluster domain-containing protein [Chloroflexota bacterium]